MSFEPGRISKDWKRAGISFPISGKRLSIGEARSLCEVLAGMLTKSTSQQRGTLPRRIVALCDNGPIRRGDLFDYRTDLAGGAWWSADGSWCVPRLVLPEFWGVLFGEAPAEQGRLFAA